LRSREDSRRLHESPLLCFDRIRERTLNAQATELDPGLFLCHHVTFTPTRMILEGPYATQSNRVIRKYEGYIENFLRVDFRDEDRLQYRWAREVDGASYLNERVGGILKGGFELAGRRFEFLAYSSSALREHAVWFMHPFKHPDYGTVTSAIVRHSLGNFEGVIREPSKYAARMAQAFTATSPSVTIRRDQWMEIPDIGSKQTGGVFTDGVGTISKELGDLIWQEWCRRDHHRRIRPAVVGFYCSPRITLPIVFFWLVPNSILRIQGCCWGGRTTRGGQDVSEAVDEQIQRQRRGRVSDRDSKSL
jgi:hypothetical protein